MVDVQEPAVESKLKKIASVGKEDAERPHTRQGIIRKMIWGEGRGRTEGLREDDG